MTDRAYDVSAMIPDEVIEDFARGMLLIIERDRREKEEAEASKGEEKCRKAK